jgi:HD-like signal output (HDOD) protein
VLLIVIVVAVVALTAAGFFMRRARSRGTLASATAVSAAPAMQREAAPVAGAAASAPAAGEWARIEAANKSSSDRLWKLAFAGPSQGQVSATIDQRVRDNVVNMLQVDTLDEKYFPRRPTLLPQLLAAVNDPTVASEKISRIIAHDPVLTADVLRLANSSMHRSTPGPIETIQRAVVVCGVDALRGMLATAMLQPTFRATRKNFPRLPRMLWERTERATVAAESYALLTAPTDRFEAQLAVLVSALGPLVVYGAALDVYARNPHFHPNSELCVALINDLSPQVARHIARHWDISPRLVTALEGSADEPLTKVLNVGELLGTLRLLESQTVITADERRAAIVSAGLPEDLMEQLFGNVLPPP